MKDLETIGIQTYNDAFENGRHESFFHYTDEKIFAAGYMDGYADSEKTKLDNIRFTITGVVCKDIKEFNDYVTNKISSLEQYIIYCLLHNAVFIDNELMVGVIDGTEFYRFPLDNSNVILTENAQLNPNYERIKHILDKGRC